MKLRSRIAPTFIQILMEKWTQIRANMSSDSDSEGEDPNDVIRALAEESQAGREEKRRHAEAMQRILDDR
jgi:hypothetical protein